MGASSSTEYVLPEQREAESSAASTGALPVLQKAFSVLSDPQTKAIPIDSLKKLLELKFQEQIFEATAASKEFTGLLDHLGSSIVDLFFLPEKGGVTWTGFLKGYTRCCGRMPVSNSFNSLLRVFGEIHMKAGLPAKLQFESSDADWKLHTWALKVVPNLSDCLGQFVQARIFQSTSDEVKLEPSCSSHSKISLEESRQSHLLTYGRAWTVSLTLRNSVREEVLKYYFPSDVGEVTDNLLYRSALHGKGLNRFWSNVEGYNGPLLVLVSVSLEVTGEDQKDTSSCIIGAYTGQGFENKDTFYGTSGYLYALSPVFHVLPSSGKEKNFVYSHLRPTGRVYEPHPKPVGIAFGGSVGNERIFIDEDFGRITIRHHAFDKTYQPGPLFPDQGFLPIEALVLEVEVWGLGGGKAKEVQNSYKKREELFTEQRRKVDLKTFSSWEDSPEKMMMDMISDPNAVRREDR